MAVQTREEILEGLRAGMVELFQIDPMRVTLDARLAEDLEIDSIDAVDLMECVRQMTHRRVPPEDFKATRTVGDLVEAAHRLVHTGEVGGGEVGGGEVGGGEVGGEVGG